nr:HAD family hydrolase [Kofleriaceae bacterium]
MATLWLFDIDGTLLHAGGTGRAAFDAVMAAQHGVDDGCRGLSFGGKTDPALVDEVFRARLGRDPTASERDAFLAAYARELPARLAASTVAAIAGVVEALTFLRAAGADAHVLGIATGNVRAGADAKLRAAGLVEWFDASVGGYGSDSHLRAELVAAAIQRGRDRGARGEVIVVGDTVLDVAAARANGAVAIAVATGGQSADQLAAAGADAVMASLHELPAWVNARATRATAAAPR